jgi:hypothetical protein
MKNLSRANNADITKKLVDYFFGTLQINFRTAKDNSDNW